MELVPLLRGARIEKIQSPGRGLFSMVFFGQGQKRQLVLKFERQKPFCFVTKPAGAGCKPDAQTMRLRKYAAGRRIAAVVEQWQNRRLWLLVASPQSQAPVPLTPEKSVWLCLDLRDGPSLHFLAAQDAPGEEEAIWPERGELEQALENWRAWPVLSPALRRCLACLEPLEGQALMADLRDGGGDVFIYRKAGSASIASAWPLPPKLRGDFTEKSGPDALPLLEEAGLELAATTRQGAGPGQKRRKKLERLLEKLSAEEERLKAMLALKEPAILLSHNLWRIAPDFKAEKLELDGVEGQQSIALNPRLTARENMERMFHEAKRGRRGLEMLLPRRAELLAELAALEDGSENSAQSADGADAPEKVAAPAFTALARSLPKKVALFISSDGYALLRGKDAEGNMRLLRMARGHDIWLHTGGGPGAHVLVRRAHPGDEVPERTLDEAGALAACKSWLREAAEAEIIYAEARHVRPLRSAAPGTVRIDRFLPSRVVRNEPGIEDRLRAAKSAGSGK